MISPPSHDCLADELGNTRNRCTSQLDPGQFFIFFKFILEDPVMNRLCQLGQLGIDPNYMKEGACTHNCTHHEKNI
jgi:hypothetical protein